MYTYIQLLIILDEPDYEPVNSTSKRVNIVEQSPDRPHSSTRQALAMMDDSGSSSSDSFNPYD